MIDKTTSQLLTTFYIGGQIYGIEVMKVQEVTGNPNIVPVPLSPPFVKGLINLRGQLATALALSELFKSSSTSVDSPMSVVCRIEGNLVSLMVDAIGDVIEAEGRSFETAPDTIPADVRRYIKGIYKMNGALLSVVDLEMLAKELSPTA